MERPGPFTDGAPPAGTLARLGWPVLFLGLVAWQAGMTLQLFGPPPTWDRLLDDRPILSGRHPLHLYHGYLGARSFHERGTTCCYDPAFQAGYPKTPVFDCGSRPAELCLGLGGGTYRPGAYKVGLAICCLSVPCILALAAWGVGLGPGACWLSAASGLLVWWGAPCRGLLDQGDLDLLLASLALLVFGGWLVRFDRAPGPLGWVVLASAGAVGWFAHPLVFAATLPLLLVYYLSVGGRHRFAWHLALLAALTIGVGVNGFWLADLYRYWWVRAPLPLSVPLLTHRTFRTFWDAGLWGTPADRTLALVLLSGSGLGIWAWNRDKERPAARLVGLGVAGLFLLALVGAAWEPLVRLGSTRLLVPALWFGGLGAANAVTYVGQWFPPSSLPGRPTARGLTALLGLGGLVFAAWHHPPRPLAIGLSPEQQGVVATLVAHTTPEARILWEDGPGAEPTGTWTALLPLLTGRAFVGGLDPEGSVEHTRNAFAGSALAGRPVRETSDAELEEYCRRYNIGWVVCWSAPALERFRAWTMAEPVTEVQDRPGGWLFRVRRPYSYVLQGRATVLRADAQHITLANVVPEDGKVVLSLHHLTGIQASPRRVQVEREYDPQDPVPLIRLRVPGPVARLTLTWEPK